MIIFVRVSELVGGPKIEVLKFSVNWIGVMLGTSTLGSLTDSSTLSEWLVIVAWRGVVWRGVAAVGIGIISM